MRTSKLTIQTKSQIKILIEACKHALQLIEGKFNVLWDFSNHPNKEIIKKSSNLDNPKNLSYDHTIKPLKKLYNPDKNIYYEIIKNMLKTFEGLLNQEFPLNLSISDELVNTLMYMCERISRLYMGQLCEILEWAADDKYIETGQYRYGFEVKNLKIILFSFQYPNEYYSIHSDKISDKSRVLYDVYTVLRHYISWRDESNTPATREWPRQMTVNYDEPMHFGAEPLIEIKEEN